MSRPPYGAALRGLIILVLGGGAAISSPPKSPRDLTQFSLEDLMNVQVTSVSKKEQKLAKTGAAIFVINQEDTVVRVRPVSRISCGWCRA